jgi:hypothetical protein
MQKKLSFDNDPGENLKFFIVDFGASLNHTHHKLAISGFAHLLKDQDFEILVPFGSEVTLNNFNPKRVLLPGTHPISFSIMKPKSWISGIHGFLHNFANRKNNFLIYSFLLNISASYFYLLIKRKATKLNIAIIFPTFCPFAMRACKLLNFMKMEIKIFARLTNTAEIRGLARKQNFLQNSLNEANNFKSVKINFGIETQSFRDYITNSFKYQFHLSPIPSENIPTKEPVENQKLVVSFLGYPTIDKGQEHILPIIHTVSKHRKDILWQVQVAENSELKTQLNNLNLNIVILEGKISQPRLEAALNLSSVICLPYNVVAFKLHASAMMYNACNFLVPILTFKGTAFANEVIEFSCGLALDSRLDLIETINSLNLPTIQKWIDGCKTYNHYRNQVNLDFLEVKKTK